MDSFGLGLLLTFKDNASVGLNNATKNFQQMAITADQMSNSFYSSLHALQSLTIAGMSMTYLGKGAVGVGEKIIGVLTGVIKKLNETGTEVFNTKLTLNTLFGSAREGDSAFEWVKQYSKTSVFNFQDLLPAMTMMKAVGIDVRKNLETSSGKAQNLLDYAGDLAAVFPNMRNMYGSGVQAAMGALKEYISEGNEISLRRGAGIDITGTLGESKGGNIEERSRQAADLIEKIKAFGMVTNLAGTPTQRLSNMKDWLYTSLIEITNSGVYQEYTKLVKRISDYIFSIPESDIKAISKTIADAIVAIERPLEKVVEYVIKFADSLRKVVKENPGLVKFSLITLGLAGITLILGGAFFVAAGTIALFAESIMTLQIVYGGFRAFFVNSIRGIIFGFAELLAKALPLVLISYVLYQAWKNNIMGIRDVIATEFGKVGLIFDALADNTLSEEKFNKARKMGLLPLIETLLDLKGNVEDFFKGIPKGIEYVLSGLDDIWEKLKPVREFFSSIGDFILPIVKKLFGYDVSSKWEFGGKIAGVVMLGLAFFKMGSFVGRLVGYIVHLTKAIIGFSIAQKIAAVTTKVLAAAQFVWNAICAANPISLIILGVMLLIGAIIVLIQHWDLVKEKVTSVVKAILEWLDPFINGVKKAVDWLRKLFGYNKKYAEVPSYKGGTTLTTLNNYSIVPANGGYSKPDISLVPNYYNLNKSPSELATGGETRGTGLAVLHPSEIVVNSSTTRDLKEFLNTQKANPFVSSPSKVDNSVTFESGSITIQTQGVTDRDLEEAANKLMKIIARKQQLKNMSRRNPVFN